MLFIGYSRCSTAKKAKEWLIANGYTFDDRDIKEDKPTRAELEKWYKMSGLPLKRFFNTSGMLYKSLGVKDKLPNMSEPEQLDLLATDGMLVKRPLLIREDFVVPGFREAEWIAALEGRK